MPSSPAGWTIVMVYCLVSPIKNTNLLRNFSITLFLVYYYFHLFIFYFPFHCVFKCCSNASALPYVKHFELPACSKGAIRSNLP